MTPPARKPGLKVPGGDHREEVLNTLRRLCPAGVVVEVWPEGEAVPDLYPEEVATVAGAVEKRRLEYAKGRATARRALQAMGLKAEAIPTGKNREPLWPEGVVGSITHCPGVVAAVVAPSSELRSIGIDVEPSDPLSADLREMVLLEEEWRLAMEPCPTNIDAGKLIFCAKEALFKAVFPITRKFLDFRDVLITMGPETGEYGAGAVREMDEEEGVVLEGTQGRYGSIGELLVAVAVLPPSG